MNNALSIVKEFNDFCDLSINELANAFKSALSATGMVLKKETLRQLKSKLPAASESSTKYNDRMIDAVRLSILKNKGNNVGQEEAFVHILGTRSSGSGTYRLRFFEGGTKDRTIKTGKFAGKEVGHIAALNFFDTAIKSSYEKMKTTMDQRISSIIDKINETKK